MKRRGPGPFNGMLYFFGIIFFFTLAMGVWLHPFGPKLWGVPWFGILSTGLLISLLIAELVPHHEKARYVKATAEIEEDERILKKEFSILIFIILGILLIAYIYALTHVLPYVSTGF